jgi:hypothetical protein
MSIPAAFWKAGKLTKEVEAWPRNGVKSKYLTFAGSRLDAEVSVSEVKVESRS